MFTTVPLRSLTTALEAPVTSVMHTESVRVPGSASLALAAQTMLVHRVHAVLVCGVDDEPLGWVTTRGLLHNTPRNWDGATARDAICESVASVRPKQSVGEALDALMATNGSHVLVRSADGTVRGVVSDFDLLDLMASAQPTGPRDPAT